MHCTYTGWSRRIQYWKGRGELAWLVATACWAAAQFLSLSVVESRGVPTLYIVVNCDGSPGAGVPTFWLRVTPKAMSTKASRLHSPLLVHPVAKIYDAEVANSALLSRRGDQTNIEHHSGQRRTRKYPVDTLEFFGATTEVIAANGLTNSAPSPLGSTRSSNRPSSVFLI